jgi:hypothetical protein
MQKISNNLYENNSKNMQIKFIIDHRTLQMFTFPKYNVLYFNDNLFWITNITEQKNYWKYFKTFSFKFYTNFCVFSTQSNGFKIIYKILCNFYTKGLRVHG